MKVAMIIKGRNAAMETAVHFQPNISGLTMYASNGTIAKVPTEKPTDPIAMAKLR